MWTLAPSLVVASQESWGEMRSLATGERWDLRPEDLPIVRALATGIPESEAEKHRELQAAVSRGWAAQAASVTDDHLRRRIEAMERRFSWCRTTVAQAAHAHGVVLDAHASRRHLHRGFAQRAALPETVVRRVALLGTVPLRVVLFGDPDFASLALVELGHRVTVLEPDNAIADMIRSRAPEGAPLEIVNHDLREPFPQHLVGIFDAFVADPLSSPGALRLVLARGFSAVERGRGFISVSEAGAETLAIVMREIGADFTENYSEFNHYYGSDFALSFYTSDLVIVRPRTTLSLRPRTNEAFFPRNLSTEELFLETPATRYSFKDINPDTCHIAHLDAALQVLESIGRLEVLKRSYYEDGGVRSYLVHTKHGSAVFIRIVPEARVGELFVAPAESSLEDSLIAVLLGLLGIQGTVVQKRRVRGSSVYTMT